MSKNLNKSRLKDTTLLIIISFVIITFVQQVSRDGNDNPHEIIEFIGLVMAIIAALGRMYCTAFVGGFKNKKIIDHGPFSVCRNPLYFFSLIGVIGISLMTVNIIIMVMLPLSVYLIYHSLIKREEAHLQAKFGVAYFTYKAKTPCLIPNVKLYHAPATIEMTPRTLLNSFRDAAMWILAYPICETIEYLQDKGFVKPLVYLHLF